MTRAEFLALSPYDALCLVVRLAAQKGALRRVVLSRPGKAECLRAVIMPKLIGGRSMLQLETFTTDNKAHHENFAPDETGVLERHMASYGQINVVTTLGVDCQWKCSSSGKQTLLHGVTAYERLCTAQTAPSDASGNDRKKQYILQGNEPFLHLLGVSDKSGRVHDKKQSKFRQINRFLELLRDVEAELPAEGELHVCDLCCGKSYLSFAVYHYLTVVKGRALQMWCVDLKADVIEQCGRAAHELGFDGLHFVCGDVAAFDAPCEHVHMVVSLHACDVATDLVLQRAMAWGSEVILSTPCCHHELNHTLDCPELDFIAEQSILRQKLCDAATDALRLLRLQAAGYAAVALELIDPDETPKNVMLRAVRKRSVSEACLRAARERYERAARFFVRTAGEAQDVLLNR